MRNGRKTGRPFQPKLKRATLPILGFEQTAPLTSLDSTLTEKRQLGLTNVQDAAGQKTVTREKLIVLNFFDRSQIDFRPRPLCDRRDEPPPFSHFEWVGLFHP